MNEQEIGKGDPIINKLESIMGGKDYPIKLISLICREKNKSFNAGKIRGVEEYKKKNEE